MTAEGKGAASGAAVAEGFRAAEAASAEGSRAAAADSRVHGDP
jgi:hypothetical protein